MDQTILKTLYHKRNVRVWSAQVFLGGLPRHIFVMPMGYGVVWFHLELLISVFGVVPGCIAAIQDIQVEKNNCGPPNFRISSIWNSLRKHQMLICDFEFLLFEMDLGVHAGFRTPPLPEPISSIWNLFDNSNLEGAKNIIFYLKSWFWWFSNIFYLKSLKHTWISSIWKAFGQPTL